MVLHPKDVMELVQKPLIDVGHLPDLVDAISTTECRRNGKDALIGRIYKFLVDVLNVVVL